MTSIEEHIRLRLRGGPPWGFRLEGGNGFPITISKIRQRSNADDAQILEGDEVLTINGRRVQHLPSDVAMAFVENSIGILELELLRRKYERGAHKIPVIKKNGLHATRRSSGDSRRLGLTNGAPVKGKPTTVQVMQTGNNSRKPNGAPGLTIRKTTTTTTKVLTKQAGDKTEKTVTKTVTERVGNQETTTTTQEVQSSDPYGEEYGPKTVVRETRFTDKPVEELMEVSEQAGYDDDDRPSHKIIIDEPAFYSPSEVRRHPYTGRDIITPKPYVKPGYGETKGHFSPVRAPSPRGYSSGAHTLPTMEIEQGPARKSPGSYGSPYSSPASYGSPTGSYQPKTSTPYNSYSSPPTVQPSYQQDYNSRPSANIPRYGGASSKVEIQTSNNDYRDQVPSYATMPRTGQKTYPSQSTAYSYPGGQSQQTTPARPQSKPKFGQPSYGRNIGDTTNQTAKPFYPVSHKPTSSKVEIVTTGNRASPAYGAPVIQPSSNSPNVRTSITGDSGQGLGMLTKIKAPTLQQESEETTSPSVPASTIKKMFEVKTPPSTYGKPKPMTAVQHGGSHVVEVKPPHAVSNVAKIVTPQTITPGEQMTLSFQAPGLNGGSFTPGPTNMGSWAPSSDLPKPEHASPGIIRSYEEADAVADEEEKEDPTTVVQPGFVKSQKKKRDLKAKRETKAKPVQRAKSFHGLPSREKGALEELSVSKTDKQKAAKTIADVIMFPKDKKLKGARMFAKQRKRTAKYTTESMGTNVDHEDYDANEALSPEVETYEDFNDAFFNTRPTRSISMPKGAIAMPGMTGPAWDDSEEDDISSPEEVNPPAAPPPPAPAFVPPPPPPPPPPPGPPQKFMWKGKEIEATNFNIDLKNKDKCSHDIVTPDAIKGLMKDMLGQSGRGAAMFQKRRDRSEQFVLDENTAKLPKPKPPGFKEANAINSTLTTNGGQTITNITLNSKKVSSGTKSGPPPAPKPKPKPADTIDMDKVRPVKFNPGSQTNGTSQTPSPKPGFGKIDFNKKPRGFRLPSNDDTMTSSTGSASFGQSGSQLGVSGSAIPVSPGGTHDFNPKPRGFSALKT